MRRHTETEREIEIDESTNENETHTKLLGEKRVNKKVICDILIYNSLT